MEEVNGKDDIIKENGFHDLELDAKFSNLKSIPVNVPQLTQTRHLSLSNNHISEFPDGLMNLMNLLSLDLSNNQLENLPRSLCKIPQLKILNLSNNKFSAVPLVLLESLHFLRVLDLSYNNIKYFTEPPCCLPNLEQLFLNNNMLIELPLWIFNSKCILKNLDISHNKLNNMNENSISVNVLVKLAVKIESLNLGNCGLCTESLRLISNMTNLEILRLGNTKIKEINNRNFFCDFNFNILQKCVLLKELDLSYDYISIIPNHFAPLKHLKYINLEGNYLSWLPDDFCNLESLEYCNLSKNSICSLPVQFGKLIKLKEIYLNQNALSEVPDYFNFFVNLEYCDFFGNKLEYINWRLVHLKSLKGIDLEDNCLNFGELCGIEDAYNQFFCKYSVMKEHYRKKINEERFDWQLIKKDEIFHSNNENGYEGSYMRQCSENSYNEQHCLLNGDSTNKESLPLENWDDEENNGISSSHSEHDYFDPNVNNDLKFKWKGANKIDVYNNNFCPADNHIPSLMKYFLKKPQDTDVEGQYDSN